MPKKNVVIGVKDLMKTYPPTTHAVNGVSLEFKKGEWTAIMGPSGSGKTTLLNMISCLDHPTNGSVRVLDKEITKLGRRALTRFRREHLGMIFQQYHLIPYLNALENVEVAQYFHSLVDKDSARESLIDLGLKDRLKHIPAKLSGGEQQRVAIARALINAPDIILADEPTGNLDRKTGMKIMEIFKELKTKGQTIIFVTHDPELARWGDRIIELVDGKIKSDKYN
jgi:putative ABC transport system ATP-binding protein